MSVKRPSSEQGSGSSSPPPAKRLQFEPIQLGPVYSQEELDVKVLQFQNRKLSERLVQRQRLENDLRDKIDQLQKRQTRDDAMLNIINRYWNQLDEDLRILLHRFDLLAVTAESELESKPVELASTSEEQSESSERRDAVLSFLAELAALDREETEEKLKRRVEFSTRTVAKLVQAFEKLSQRHEKLYEAVERQAQPGEADDASSKGERPSVELLRSLIDEEMQRVLDENKHLHRLVTQLEEKNHRTGLQFGELTEKLAAAETELAELKNKAEDLEYELERSRRREEKLDRHLTEAMHKLKEQEGDVVQVVRKDKGQEMTVSSNHFDELQNDLEEQRELAASRLAELEKLNKDHQMALKEMEALRIDLRQLPESAIVESPVYKNLQSQYSVLYNELVQARSAVEEARNQVATARSEHVQTLERLESEEMKTQKKLRDEMIEMEDQINRLRSAYDEVKTEFQHQVVANDQTGPINKEMRNLISTLQSHNRLLKGEASRYKKKHRETQSDFDKLKARVPRRDDDESNASTELDEDSVELTRTPSSNSSPTNAKKREDDAEEGEIANDDRETTKELQQQLKKAQDREREMKLLLDMYKTASRETRDKVKLMLDEKKSRQEVDELKQQIHLMKEAEKKDRKRLADDEAVKKIKKLEEQIQDIQKNLSATKQEEDALLSEMEVTGQAFEDMQEQNSRLLQQLREKDDANLKFMSERIKWQQLEKLFKEEREALVQHVNTLQEEIDAQAVVIRKLEEKERVLHNSLAAIEKELRMRQESLETFRRKAAESSQAAADLQRHLDRYQSQLKEAQNSVSEKTEALENEAFKHRRLREEVLHLRRKLERVKKFEMAASADEVLLEEIRDYKDQLRCPSCKVKQKDAVLTKCFHVFCLDCLKTRYETRQRKCPKCNAAFGANDYHRIYLS